MQVKPGTIIDNDLDDGFSNQFSFGSQTKKTTATIKDTEILHTGITYFAIAVRNNKFYLDIKFYKKISLLLSEVIDQVNSTLSLHLELGSYYKDTLNADFVELRGITSLEEADKVLKEIDNIVIKEQSRVRL
jgi:hypothetical protein